MKRRKYSKLSMRDLWKRVNSFNRKPTANSRRKIFSTLNKRGSHFRNLETYFVRVVTTTWGALEPHSQCQACPEMSRSNLSLSVLQNFVIAHLVCRCGESASGGASCGKWFVERSGAGDLAIISRISGFQEFWNSRL